MIYKVFKKVIPVLMLCITLILSSCGKSETSYTPLQIATAMAESQESNLALSKTVLGSDVFEYTVNDLYGIALENISDGAIVAAGSVNAFEISVLKLSEDADAEEIKDLLDGYISYRLAQFIGYFPEEELILRSSRSFIKNGYAVLEICPDISLAEKTFNNCFNSDPSDDLPTYPDMQGEGKKEDTKDDWEYDHDLLVSAWETENYSGLSDNDKAILNQCKYILDICKKDNQTIPEYELAIHDWLIDHMEYDPAEIDNYGGTPDPNNDNPYGALINGKGICAGYTRSFQLLMDLAGIECISIFGTSNNGIEIGEHAWNQVKLDGEWYIVDVTWDDPVGSTVISQESHHRYFNVTSKKIRSNHFWDEANVPEATGTKYTWDYLR